MTITLIETEITDWTEEGEVTWNTCHSMFENDPAVIPTVPFEVPGTVGLTNAPLLASGVATGTGPGDLTAVFMPSTTHSTLTLAHGPEGEVWISGLRLVAVTEPTFTHASLTLRNVAATHMVPGHYIVAPEQANFVAALAFEGDSRIVDMTNSSSIVLRESSTGDWELQPFELSYFEPDFGIWTLSLEQMSFRPDPQ